MLDRRLPGLLCALWLLGSSPAFAQAGWNDGSFSRLQHICNQFVAQTVEDLAWTWVGYQGQPKSGDVYYVRIAVGALGCSGAFVLPELKLPRKTQFAITAQTPIRCFMSGMGGQGRTQLTDGSCPSQPYLGHYPYDNGNFPNANGSGYPNNFFSFPPTSQPYWPLYQRILYIEVPVKTTLAPADPPLSGFASNDYLLGAANVLDNNPGGPAVQWDGHPSNYSGNTIPSTGAWQGVFLSQGASTVTRLAYPEPSARNVSMSSAETHVHVFNADCVNPKQVAMNLLYGDGGDTGPEAVDPGAGGSGCGPVDGGQDCYLRWIQLKPNTEYLWWAEFPAGSTTNCGSVQVDPAKKRFRTPGGATSTKYAVLVTQEGPGTVALNPPGGIYSPTVMLELTATPSPGARFDGWKVDGVAQAGPNPLVLSVDAEHVIIARFSSPDGGSAADGGSTGSDAGSNPTPDAGGSDNGDGGTAPGGGNKGCGCNGGGAQLAALAALALALLGRRRAPKG